MGSCLNVIKNLISSFLLLWSEAILCMIPVLCYLVSLALRPRMRSLLEYDPLGTNAHPALGGGSVLLCYLGQVCSLSCSNLCLNWNLLNLQSFFSISARGVLKPPLLLWTSLFLLFLPVNFCFLYFEDLSF